MNFAPFYIGQKVVAVDAMPNSMFKNGQIYTVNSCTFEESGNPISPAGKKYWYVGVVGSHPHCRPGIFRPLEEIKFPSMTFEQIKKVEKEEMPTLN